MTLQNNKVVKVPTWSEIQAKSRESRVPPPPRTSTEGFVEQEETPDQKRKREEITKMQALHEVSEVDAAGAASMDDIDLCEPFPGFNFTSTHAHNRSARFYEHAFPIGGMSYEDDIPDTFGPESWSTETVMPGSIYPEGTSYFYPDNAYQNTHAGFKPSYYGFADDDNLGSGSLTQHDAGQTYDADWAPLHGDSSVQACYDGSVPAHQNDAGQANHSGFALFDHATDHTNDNGFVPVHHSDVDRFATGFGDANQAADAYKNSAQGAVRNKNFVSAPPLEESDFTASEYEDERPCKAPKLNKDGAPRKPRQPRAKLLKWTDDDWKNVLLGIVWACGETGVQIPFQQAAQVVGETCTAGALQQALLKLRVKQIAEGHKIPSLRMAWTRKKDYTSSKASREPEANKLRKNTTGIVKFRRAYKDEDRQGMARPYKWKKPSRKTRSGALQSTAKVKQEVTTVKQEVTTASPTYSQAGGVHGYGHGSQMSTVSQGNAFLPDTRRHIHESSPAVPFGPRNGYLQGTDMGAAELASLLTTEGIEQYGNSFADASDNIFSTE